MISIRPWAKQSDGVVMRLNKPLWFQWRNVEKETEGTAALLRVSEREIEKETSILYIEKDMVH